MLPTRVISIFLPLYLRLSYILPKTEAKFTCPTLGRKYQNVDGDNNEIRLDTRDPVRRVGEISGLAFSPSQKAPSGENVIYAMGDGGALERIGIWDPLTGERLMTLQISNTTTTNQDWEAMTIGSCGNTGVEETCLYIMDAGDNTARNSNGKRSRRETLQVPYRLLKIKEPILSDYEDNGFINASEISILNFDYFHESSPTSYADCETMFLDHKGWGEDDDIGDIYLVTKWNRQHSLGKTRLFKIPPFAWPDTYDASVGHYSPPIAGNDINYMWTSVERENRNDIVEQTDWVAGTGYTTITGGQLMGQQWRGGEMSFDGSMIALGSTSNLTIFLRQEGQSVLNALAAPNATSKWCLTSLNPVRGQTETLAFSPDSKKTVNVPEGNRPRLGWMDLKFNGTNQTTSFSDSILVPSNITTDVISDIPKNTTTNPLSTCPSIPMLCNTVIGVKERVPPGTLLECQGDCDANRECAGSLICHQRDRGNSSVPGCVGNADTIGNGRHDFCIRPEALLIQTDSMPGIATETINPSTFKTSSPSIAHSISPSISPSIHMSDTPTAVTSARPTIQSSIFKSTDPSTFPTMDLSTFSPTQSPFMTKVQTFQPSKNLLPVFNLEDTSGAERRILSLSGQRNPVIISISIIFFSVWFLW